MQSVTKEEIFCGPKATFQLSLESDVHIEEEISFSH